MTENFFALVRAGLHGGVPILDDPDWEALVTLAGSHGVLSPVYDAMRRREQSGDVLPDQLLVRVRERCTVYELRSFQIVREAQRIAGLLADSGIEALFLKGVVLQQYYPRPAMRSMGDIDMLAAGDNFGRVATLLCRSGYSLLDRESDGQSTLTGPGDIACDLHRHLMGERFLDSDKVMGAFTLAPQPFSLDGVGALTLTDEELLLHIIVHAVKHYLDTGLPLRMLCDLCLFVKAKQETLDFARMIELLRPASLHTTALVMLRVCVVHLGLVPNEALADALRGCDEALTEAFVNDVVARGANPESDATERAAAQLAFSFGTGAQQFPLKSYLHALFPTPTLMKMDYPVLHRHPYLYPACLVRRLWRLLWGKLTGRRDVRLGQAVARARDKRRIIEQLGIVK